VVRAGQLEEVKEDDLEFEEKNAQEPIMTFRQTTESASGRESTQRPNEPDDSLRSGFGSRDNSQRPLHEGLEDGDENL